MNFTIEQIIEVAIVLVTLGIAWGQLSTKISRIEKMLGNGQSPFLHRDEATVLQQKSESEHESIYFTITELTKRVAALEEYERNHHG